MTIRDLSTVDIVATARDGATMLIAVAVGWQPESVRLVQLALKLDGMRAYGETRAPYRIQVVCKDEDPPESVAALVRQVDGELLGSNWEPAVVRPGVFRAGPSGDLDWPSVHAANAALFAQEHGLDGTLESLRQLDDVLAAAYGEAVDALDPGGAVPEVREDGDLAVLAGAYASVVMLTAFGGSWRPAETGLPATRVRLGADGRFDVGAFAKVRKFLRDGPADAVHPLVLAVVRAMRE